MLRFVDVSGYGQSGKSVISDLLREFDGYFVPHNLFEFDLIRVPGGLLDLYHALVEDWSVVRSDAAIRRFRKVAYRMGEYARLGSPRSLMCAYGTNYQQVFRQQYFDLTDQFVSSLVSAEFQKEWPYPALEDGMLQIFRARIARSIGLGKTPTRKFALAAPSPDFADAAAKYLRALFHLIVPQEFRNVVLHNALEPFNPVRGMQLLGDAREIVVARDPRDIYASLFVKDGVFIPDFLIDDKLWQLKASMVAAHDLDLFIRQQRILLGSSRRERDDESVLRLNYEDIVMNYGITLDKIRDFLGEKAAVHILPKRFFDPESSKKNVGIWRRVKDQSSIGKIRAELSEYCWELS